MTLSEKVPKLSPAERKKVEARAAELGRGKSTAGGAKGAAGRTLAAGAGVPLMRAAAVEQGPNRGRAARAPRLCPLPRATAAAAATDGWRGAADRRATPGRAEALPH